MKTFVQTNEGTYEIKYDYIDLFGETHYVSADGTDIFSSDVIFSYDTCELVD